MRTKSWRHVTTPTHHAFRGFLPLLCILELLAADAGRVDVYHPGHPPYHVTRLHRYDHTGVDSMLQAESRWMKGESMASLLEVAERDSSRRVRGPAQVPLAPELPSLSVEDADDLGGDFVTLSEPQVKALTEHQTMWLGDRQHVAAVQISSQTKAAGGGRLRPNSDFIGQMQAYRASHPGLHEGYAVTGLSSLSSQYVGPIGVGTVMRPVNCIANATALNSTPFRYLRSAVAGLAGYQDCHLEVQSQVWVVFDTGSTNIWIASDLCVNGPCAVPGRHRYNHTASSTFDSPSSMLQLTVQFGTGQITGPQAVDDFHIGPFTVYSQTFAMIQTEQGTVFEDVPFEGIVGLAYPAMSANGAKPFFDSVIEQGSLKQNEFAFYFSRKDPSANAVLWGGVDPAFYHGQIEYFPVADPYYWSLRLRSFKIGRDELLGCKDCPSALIQTADGEVVWANSTNGTNATTVWGGPFAIVDTGTTFFTAEGAKFAQVMSRLPAARCGAITSQTHPPITISLVSASGADRDFVLDYKQYMTANGKGRDAQCTPAFMRVDVPKKHGPAMVLGEVFLRHHFAVFDRADGDPKTGRVGLAQSLAEDATAGHLRELTKDQPAFSHHRGAMSAAADVGFSS